MTRAGVTARRGWLGMAAATVGLAALTALPARNHAALSLASVALLYLVPVVAAAVIGGVWPALAAAQDPIAFGFRRAGVVPADVGV